MAIWKLEWDTGIIGAFDGNDSKSVGASLPFLVVKFWKITCFLWTLLWSRLETRDKNRRASP
ncbi:subunit of Retromer complex [Corchorus olitorius]|uniref:Subunit of Retromer complex n=1 Tax=Corchorus olitorius TaxID=93759 RepID=A0A1R3HXT3_9ROSI|nr:subunit of Retromer complex [Corchorus olitorius]